MTLPLRRVIDVADGSYKDLQAPTEVARFGFQFSVLRSVVPGTAEPVTKVGPFRLCAESQPARRLWTDALRELADGPQRRAARHAACRA